MKICRIRGLNLKNWVEKNQVILLCNHCYEADAQYSESARIVSYSDYTSDYDVSCEGCYKTLEEEREEVT
jgi:hypothetical protein